MINSNFKKKMADSWFAYLQSQICKELEFLENNKFKFLSNNRYCDGSGRAVDFFGYASNGNRFDGKGLAPDLLEANLNSVHLAWSLDGVRWTRFVNTSALDGRGAVVMSANPWAVSLSNNCGGVEAYNMHRNYGVGYPAALVRDQTLELFVSDYTNPNSGGYDINDIDCNSLPYPPKELNNRHMHRIRISITELLDANAWTKASQFSNRDIPAYHGFDIKWMPDANRYAIATISEKGNPYNLNFIQYPTVLWSDVNPPKVGPLPPFDIKVNRFPSRIPTPTGPGRVGGWTGALLGNSLGQINIISGPNVYPHIPFHLYYPARDLKDLNVLGLDIDHAIEMCYPPLLTTN